MYLNISFLRSILQIIVCRFAFGHYVSLLCFTASDYTFGIFKFSYIVFEYCPSYLNTAIGFVS